MDILLNKLPPQNIGSEEAVLSALFIDNSGFNEIEELKPKYFYKASHQKIFSAMLDLFKKNEPVDLVTVADALQKKDELEMVGGALYLVRISDEAPVATNISAYSKHIIEAAKAREMIKIASSIIENGMNCKDIEKYISDSQTKILDVQSTGGQDEFFDMPEMMFDAITRIEGAQSAEFKTGLNLGLGILDNYMQVFGAKLIIIAARPGMGKTALAFSIAINIGYQEESTGILSIEMDKEQFEDRTLAAEADVNGMGFYVPGKVGPAEISKLDNAARSLSTLPITVNDSTAGIEDVGRRCKAFKKMGKKLIIIDQLNQIKHESGLKPHEAIGKNCTAIKQLTRELKIPIILLCQLSRKVEDRAGDNRPILSDLADTGKIEQDADMVLFLFREGYYKKDIDPSRTEIDLAKNRQGKPGIEKRVLFRPNRSMFSLMI